MSQSDDVSPFLESLIGELQEAKTGLKGLVVVQSQQVTGNLSQRQQLSLKDRLEQTDEGAMARAHLEAAKKGEAIPEDAAKVDEVNDAVAEKYVDEIIAKFLGGI